MRVAIFYHFIAHYRKEVFLELQKKGDYHYYADNFDYTSQGIQGVGKEELPNFHKAECVRLFGNFMWQKGVLSASVSSDYDALIYLANPYYISTWVSAFVARLMGKRVFFWTIGWHRPFKPVKDAVKILFYSVATGFLLYNNRNKKLIEKVPFLSNKKISVVFNSISGGAVLLPQDVSNLTNLAPGYLICVSRLEGKRGIEKVMDAMKILSDDSGEKLDLLLVGDGSERKNLEEYSKKLGMNVQFWGASYDKEELARLYFHASMTVAPSMVGLTAIQSMLHGVPVVTHSDYMYQAPESEAVIDGVTGFLFDRDDLQGLAKAIERGKETFNDSAKRVRIKENCLREIEMRWSPESQAQRVHDAIEE